MHDPYQMYSSLLGMHQNPYAINPLAAIGGPQGIAGGWGQQNPFFGGGQNPLQQLTQNPLQQLTQNPLQQLAQHPLLTLALQNPLLGHVLAQQYLSSQIAPQYGYTQQVGQPFGQQGGLPFGQQFGQGISPFAQVGNPLLQTGYPLAPQTWIGQQGLGGGVFSHLGGRGLQGSSPWGGF